MPRVRHAAKQLLLATLLATGIIAPVAASAQYPPVVSRSRLDPSKGVNFHAILLPDTVYVGQQATYQIGVFLNQEVRQRLRRNPEFVPPETRSLLVYDLPDAKAPLVGTIDGRAYEVHVFQRAFFALSPGRYEIPPSRLTYALPQSASFFSREESHAMRSEALSLVVLPVPTAGRPADWGGAVGEWRAALRVDSSSGRVGDPLVVTLRIEGRGNVTLLPRPRLSVGWGALVPADERVEFDSTPSTLRGAKEFDWLLTPREAGRREIPSQRFVYFNPVARRFELALSEALDVAVREGESVAEDSAAAAPLLSPEPPPSTGPTLAVRPDLGTSASRSWVRAPWFVALLLLAPLPALAGVIRRRPRRARAVPTHAQRLDDASRAPFIDPAAVRRLTHDALRDRTGLDAGLALAEGTLVADLRHEGVTVETARRAETLLRLLDAAVFSGARSAPPPSAADLAALVTSINEEARRGTTRRARRGPGRRAVPIAMLVVFAAAAPLLARQEDDAAKSWASAHTAFAGQDYALSARHFLDVARVRPSHPNAWANVGTSAWLDADTARAVQGWQRALRLAPASLELRDRLALVRAVQDRGAARVPPVPVQFPTILLLLVWCAGWAVIARRAWSGRPAAMRAAWLVAVGSVGFAAAAWLDDVQRADQFVVVVRPEPLRALPVLGAEPGAAPLTGEVGRVLERQGAWAHIRLEGQRQGWIAAELLLPLGDD
ncbi:MAG: hypothetical protein P3B98_08380 [Gemmatimonadota bacterium]|nr:hypothetical protein [Gemmatimonadota bacterium]